MKNCQKVKLHGSLTTKYLKKPHSSRQVGGEEMWRWAERWWNGQSHILVWWIKIRRDTSGVRDPSPRPDHTAQVSSIRKINPYNFWL